MTRKLSLTVDGRNVAVLLHKGDLPADVTFNGPIPGVPGGVAVSEKVTISLEIEGVLHLPDATATAGRETVRGFSQYEECRNEMNANVCLARCKVSPMPMGLFGY